MIKKKCNYLISFKVFFNNAIKLYAYWRIRKIKQIFNKNDLRD